MIDGRAFEAMSDEPIKRKRGPKPKTTLTSGLSAPQPLLPLDRAILEDLRAAGAVERAAAAGAKRAAQTVQAPPDEALPYGMDIAEMDRMARQFMRRAEMAAIVGIPDSVLADCADQFAPLRHVLERGAALTIDKASANILAAVDAGDLGASRFVLERKGGWTLPRDAPTIVVQSGVTVTIDGAHISDIADAQRDIRTISEAEIV